MITETEALNKATEASGEAVDWMVSEQVVPLRDVHMLIRSIYKSMEHLEDNAKTSKILSKCPLPPTPPPPRIIREDSPMSRKGK